MSVLRDAATEPIRPTDHDSRVARASGRELARLLRDDGKRGEIPVHLTTEDGRDVELTLPRSTLRLLQQALEQMAEGRGVALVPVAEELTTQEAADLLRVSRPFLIKLLDAGAIPCRRVGTHRRVLYSDVQRYLQEERRRREGVMQELASETERLGL